MTISSRLGDFLNDSTGHIIRPRVYNTMRADWMPASAWQLMKYCGAADWAGVAALYGLEMPNPRPGRAILKCNQWLAEEHIDRGVPLADLLPEYERRHREETGLETTDMRSGPYGVIRKERQRRARAARAASTEAPPADEANTGAPGPVQAPEAAEATGGADEDEGPDSGLCDCGRGRKRHWVSFHILAGNSQIRHASRMRLCWACYKEFMQEDREAAKV